MLLAFFDVCDTVLRTLCASFLFTDAEKGRALWERISFMASEVSPYNALLQPHCNFSGVFLQTEATGIGDSGVVVGNSSVAV